VSDKILVLDVGLGNVGSICNMLTHVGFESYRSSSITDVQSAEKIILPGVGAFDTGMKALHSANLVEPLKEVAARNDTYILGICLGMQMLLNASEEGEMQGLGLVEGKVKHFPTDTKVKIPHMGWNFVKMSESSQLYSSAEELRFYFVHSYIAECENPNHSVGIAHHGRNFTCMVERSNIMGVQFHPEKSHRFGMTMLKTFASL